MKPNLGTIDRAFRLVLGILLLVAPFVSGMGIFASGIATTIAVVAGLILVATSAMRFCPLYRIFGIRTCNL